jgi:hypothetical protein
VRIDPIETGESTRSPVRDIVDHDDGEKDKEALSQLCVGNRYCLPVHGRARERQPLRNN